MKRAVLVVALLLAAGCVAPQGVDATSVHFPGVRIDTRLGSFTFIVFENETPATAAFVSKLVTSKYYEGRQFGRVIPGFVIQEVDRTGGTTDQKENVKLENATRVMFSAGALGIARDSDPNSGGSEFFVMDFAISSLYGNYTAFGQVVDGMDVVHAIARVPAVKTGPASLVGSPPGSPLYFGVHDRVPVDPVVMTKVALVDVALPRDVAARYPLHVGATTRSDAFVATLEWPADLRAGAASDLSWYVLARDASPQRQAQDPPDPYLKGVTITVEPGGATLTPVEDAKAKGALHVSWTPYAAANYTLHLMNGTSELAASELVVK